jgi:5-formyltetrahydrofolate cyclo-ligase
VAAAKNVLRARILAARRALTDAERERRAAALTSAVLDVVTRYTGPICAYVPMRSEPGAPEMLDRLTAAGHDVWLPVVVDSGALDWARHDGAAMTTGPLGIAQPAGPLLGRAAVARAGLVLLPGLAADRSGVRLGRGRGHYDRTLALAGPATPLVVLLNDEELLDDVPAEAHDKRVHGALLPGCGLVRLGNTLL